VAELHPGVLSRLRIDLLPAARGGQYPAAGRANSDQAAKGLDLRQCRLELYYQSSLFRLSCATPTTVPVESRNGPSLASLVRNLPDARMFHGGFRLATCHNPAVGFSKAVGDRFGEISASE
jgi:hypothetical protein